MQSLPKHPIFEFNPDLIISLRGRHNLEKPGDMDKAIDIFEEWLKHQEHIINKKYSREYLERFIINQKGSIERAKTAIDKLSTLRTLLPRFFEENDIRKIYKNIQDAFLQVFLPKQTKENYRIYIAQTMKNGFDSEIIFSSLQLSALFCDYFNAVDYSDGTIIISDFTGIDMISAMKAINVVDIRQAIAAFLEDFGFRVKATHFISPSPTIELLVKFLKGLLKKKLADRIHVHKSVEDLHKFVPKHLLPADYGGDLKSLKEFGADWVDLLSSEESINLIEDIRRNKTDEKRLSTVQFNERYMGMAGSFRTFTVD